MAEKGKNDIRVVRDLKKLLRRVSELETVEGEHKSIVEAMADLARFPSENPDPVLRVSAEGILIYANEAGKPLLNIWNSRIGKKLPEELSEEISRVLSSGKRAEIEVRCKDRVIALALCPVVDSGYVNLYGHDRTERKRAEEALRASEANYREIFNSANDGIFIHDMQTGQFLDVSRKGAEMLGYTPEEMRAMKVVDISMGESHYNQYEAMRRVAKAREQPQLFEWRCKKKDGQPIWVEVNLKTAIISHQKRILAVVRDITARKRGEEDRHRTEAFLRLILENSPEGINFCRFDPDTEVRKLVWCNDVFAEMSGRSREELLASDNIDSFVTRVEQPPNAPKRIVDGQPTRGVASWNRPDGKENYYEWTAVLLKIDGQPHVVGIDRDITDRKRTEAERQRAEALLRLILKHSPDGINVCQTDAKGSTRKLVMCNDVFMKMSGRSRGELQACVNLNDFVVPIEQPPNTPEQLMTGLPMRGIASWIRPDGKENYYEWTAILLEINGKPHIIGIDRDITERKLTEAERQRTEALLRFILENSPDGINICQTDLEPFTRKLVMCNDKFVAMSGYSREELQASDNLNDLTVSIERDQDIQEQQTSGFPLRGVSSWIRPDGKENYYEWTAVLLELYGKSHIIGIDRDITDRRRTDVDLENRATELASVIKELEAFTDSVSHDLRSPLRAMRGFSQLLLEDHSANLDARGIDYLNRIHHATEHMDELIDDLLNLSLVRRMETERQMVDMSAMAKTLAAELRSIQPERDVNFIVQEDLTTNADERLLRIAIHHLLENAWKFTSRQPSATIEFGSTITEGRFAYFVRDNGVGFDMAHSHRLFEAFERLHSKDEFPGTGIGLTIVQRIIDRHGGKIWVQSAPDQGATIYFTLE